MATSTSARLYVVQLPTALLDFPCSERCTTSWPPSALLRGSGIATARPVSRPPPPHAPTRASRSPSWAALTQCCTRWAGWTRGTASLASTGCRLRSCSQPTAARLRAQHLRRPAPGSAFSFWRLPCLHRLPSTVPPSSPSLSPCVASPGTGCVGPCTPRRPFPPLLPRRLRRSRSGCRRCLALFAPLRRGLACGRCRRRFSQCRGPSWTLFRRPSRRRCRPKSSPHRSAAGGRLCCCAWAAWMRRRRRSLRQRRRRRLCRRRGGACACGRLFGGGSRSRRRRRGLAWLWRRRRRGSLAMGTMLHDASWH